MKHTLQVFTFQYKENKILNLKSISVRTLASKELALATLYNVYEISYVRDNEQGCIACNFQFGWVPTQITFAAIYPIKNDDFYFSYDLTNPHTRRKMKQILNELIKINQDGDFGWNGKAFNDMSQQMSEWHWKLTLPKGYELLRPGETILESDREYDNISSRNRSWHSNPSWYNIGKEVGKGLTWKSHNQDGTVTSGQYHPDPLICRKRHKEM